ncbi:MAG: hypothetical protein MJZ81_10790 [Bacteroidales bacterium]|nr:hypothetical protein [Bacteroidales bacterium]
METIFDIIRGNGATADEKAGNEWMAEMGDETNYANIVAKSDVIDYGVDEPSLSADRPSRGISAGDIYALLYDRYMKNAGEYAVAGEVMNDSFSKASRRYDFVAVNCWSRQTIDVVEIKISNSDLRHEIEHPEKHNVVFEYIDYYYLAAPDDVIGSQIDVIPKNWGLYAVKKGEDGKWFLRKRRSAMALHDERRDTLHRGFAFSMIRAIESQSALRHSIQKMLADEFRKGYAACKDELGRRSNLLAESVPVKEEDYKWLVKCHDFVHRIGVWTRDPADLEKMAEQYSRGLRIAKSADRLRLYMSNLGEASERMLKELDEMCDETEKEK